jgi:hypothetical protein
MKTVFYLLIIGLVWAGCEIHEKQPLKNIIFESDRDTIDFGVIFLKDTLEQRVKITNNGTDTLKILNAVAACGCTVPKLKDTLIAGGKSTFIHVKYKPNLKDTGKFSKSVVLKTNCEEPFKLIRIIGNIKSR